MPDIQRQQFKSQFKSTIQITIQTNNSNRHFNQTFKHNSNQQFKSQFKSTNSNQNSTQQQFKQTFQPDISNTIQINNSNQISVCQLTIQTNKFKPKFNPIIYLYNILYIYLNKATASFMIMLHVMESLSNLCWFRRFFFSRLSTSASSSSATASSFAVTASSFAVTASSFASAAARLRCKEFVAVVTILTPFSANNRRVCGLGLFRFAI